MKGKVIFCAFKNSHRRCSPRPVRRYFSEVTRQRMSNYARKSSIVNIKLFIVAYIRLLSPSPSGSYYRLSLSCGKIKGVTYFAHVHFVERFTCSLLVVIPTLGDVPKPCYEVSSFLRGISARTQSRRRPITTVRIIFLGQDVVLRLEYCFVHKVND